MVQCPINHLKFCFSQDNFTCMAGNCLSGVEAMTTHSSSVFVGTGWRDKASAAWLAQPGR